VTEAGGIEVYTLMVEVGRGEDDGLPPGADGAAILCYAAAATEREAVNGAVQVLREANLVPLEVTSHGSLAEREAEGHDITEADRSLMQRAIDENAVIVAQFVPFEDDGSQEDPQRDGDDGAAPGDD